MDAYDLRIVARWADFAAPLPPPDPPLSVSP
jgi:hypothetical protein